MSIYICVFIMGLIIGSFLNVVIYRLPIQLARQQWLHCQVFFVDLPLTPSLPELPSGYQEKLTLFLPRSHCTQCKNPIFWHDNIPVLSYFLLKGRCRHCKAAISIQYPVIELVSGLISLMAVYFFGFTWAGLGAFIFGTVLLCLASIDLRHYLLPDHLTLPFIWLGLIFNLYNTFTSLAAAVLGAMLGYLFLWSIYWLFKFFTHKEAMGYGDFKLLAMLGAWLGWQQLPLVILIASTLGILGGSIYLHVYKKSTQTPIPFGPFLASGGWIGLILLKYTGLSFVY